MAVVAASIVVVMYMVVAPVRAWLPSGEYGGGPGGSGYGIGHGCGNMGDPSLTRESWGCVLRGRDREQHCGGVKLRGRRGNHSDGGVVVEVWGTGGYPIVQHLSMASANASTGPFLPSCQATGIHERRPGQNACRFELL